MKKFIISLIGCMLLFIVIDFGRCEECKMWNLDNLSTAIVIILAILSQLFIMMGTDNER